MENKYQYIDAESIVNKQFFEGIKEIVICIICTGIVANPMQCKQCENIFCSDCIKSWCRKSSTCPLKCSTFETKEASRTIKNLLDKLIFKCANKCQDQNDFTYENLMKHIYTSCDKLKSNCPCCDSFVLRSQIKETEVIRELKCQIIRMETENANLKNRNKELSSEIQNINQINKTFISAASQSFRKKEDDSPSLVDKCLHFKGNYNPIFACCDKAFPCYVCHNENQNHSYQFSNKVICLVCNEIYMGSTCPGCQTTQMYKKK